MKFIISTHEFNYLINKCLNVVSQKATVPILSNILIEAANDELTLTATDLIVGIKCFTESKILEEGSTTLPAKKLAQLVKELTSVNLEVSSNSHEVTEIIADSSKFKLNGMNKNTFPALPPLEDAVQFTLKQADLKEMLFRTAFAVSKEDNRYALTGVNVQIANSTATFLGTDGKRLARAYLSISLDPNFTGTYTIPLKTVEEILKNLGDEDNATVFLMSDKIAVEYSQTVIISKLLSGDYPDVDRVIPENSDIIVSLHREELITLLRQISLFTNDNSSVRFTFSEGELRLTANTMDVGEGKVSMPVNYHNEKLDIAFNPIYFLDILRHCKAETVSIGMTDAYNPVIISDKELDSQPRQKPTPLFVLMPLRLYEE